MIRGLIKVAGLVAVVVVVGCLTGCGHHGGGWHWHARYSGWHYGWSHFHHFGHWR
jgi:hypothetical protein